MHFIFNVYSAQQAFLLGEWLLDSKANLVPSLDVLAAKKSITEISSQHDLNLLYRALSFM